MPLYICATVEIDLAILCGCAPALKPMFSPVIHRVTKMISTATGSGSHSSHGTKVKDSTITRSTAISQRISSQQAEGDKIPMHTIAPGRRHSIDSDELSDELNDFQRTTGIPTSHASNSARGPARALSRTSSQRTMLAHPRSSSWDAESDFEGDDTVPQIPSVIRPHKDVSKTNHKKDWRMSRSIRADWV
jgi:hypothetical protein